MEHYKCECHNLQFTEITSIVKKRNCSRENMNGNKCNREVAPQTIENQYGL
jgi:hypothetical protein